MAARRPASLLKAKSKDRKPRVSRSEAYRINVKYMGEEPVFTKPLTPSEYGNALNWYNCMADKDEAREYTYTYLKNEGRLEELKALRRENAELRRANEILKAASAYFAKELDRPRTR